MDKQRRLTEILHERSFRTGHFVLTSGKTSNFYIDVRATATHAEGSALIGDLLLDLLQELGGADAVAGMELGAVPVVIAAVARSHDRGAPVDGLLVRKEAKAHGVGKRLVGVARPGMKVLIVDDVVTTAGSTLKTVEAVREEIPDVEIVGVACVVDRQEGGAALLAEKGYALRPLVTIDHLVALGERPAD